MKRKSRFVPLSASQLYHIIVWSSCKLSVNILDGRRLVVDALFTTFIFFSPHWAASSTNMCNLWRVRYRRNWGNL
jgi:hypothetical protein